MSTVSRDRLLAEHGRIEATLPGSGLPWLAGARRAALERFASNGIPTLADEDWKYTSLSRLDRLALLAPPLGDPESAPLGVAPAALLSGLEGPVLVFVDGRHSPALSRVGALPAGTVVMSLAQAFERAPRVLEEHLLDGLHHTVFGALNTAFMADGAFVRLPRGAVMAEPIHWLFVATAAGVAMHPRNLVVAGEGARALIVEHHVDAGSIACLTNVVTQIVAAPGASIEHCKVQRQSPEAVHLAGIHARLRRGSAFTSHSIALGAGLARNDITASLEAVGATAELNGLYLAGGRQHVDHHTRIDHAGPECTSREFYRGILDGASRGVFNGRVIVHPGAQRTDAHQANHNLLLSRDAEVDTKPQLEIYADDVKCTHGATVGQLDESQVFYLRSRGLADAAARSLLVGAFAAEVTGRVSAPSLRATLHRMLSERLGAGDAGLRAAA